MSDKDFNLALSEVGAVTPWWSDEDQLFVFEHDAYPMVMHGDTTVEATIQGYHRALRHFVQARLAGQIADSVNAVTRGRGGVRAGAGRPKGSSKKPAKVSVRLIPELAQYLKGNEEAQLRMLQVLQQHA